MTKTHRDVFLVSASGLLLALAFPAANLSLCAWVGLVPLLWSLMKRPPLQAFALGWLCGFVFAIGTLYWVVNPIRHYTDAPIFVAGLALILLAAVMGLYTGVFAGGVSRVERAGVAPELVGPPLWVALEWLRSSGPLAFPWVALGYSQHGHHDLIQVVELTGVYGVSALLVFSNMVAYSVLAGGRGALVRRWRALTILAVLVVGLPVVGHLRLEAMAQAQGVGRLRVGIVQANIDQGRKWDPAFQQAALARHARLTAAASRMGAGLVVWAETAAPFYFQAEGPQRERVIDLAVTNEVDLLFGSPAFGYDSSGLRLFNRANLVRRDGTIGGFYDKLRLVPFGEYVPFRSVLFFVDKMVEGVGNFAPGREATIFHLPEGRFGVLICYEGIFPPLSRHLVSRGADFLVNITNDAWFGDTSAPHQHLAMVTLRAIENRVPIVRVANTGISAIVDIDGRVRWQTGLFESAVRQDILEWPRVDTFYTSYGDVFAGFCGLASAALIGYAETRRRRR